MGTYKTEVQRALGQFKIEAINRIVTMRQI